MNEKVYVLSRTEANGDVKVKVYRSKESAAAYAMEYIYGEDWEIQMGDEEWDDSAIIGTNYEDLLDGSGFATDDDVVWILHETTIED